MNQNDIVLSIIGCVTIIVIIILLLRFFKGFFRKLINEVSYISKELLLTLSNRKSLLSSKRIERMILFNTALWMLIFYVYHTRDKITTLEISGIATLLFGYAGYNTYMTRKDKLDTTNAENTKTNAEGETVGNNSN